MNSEYWVEIQVPCVGMTGLGIQRQHGATKWVKVGENTLYKEIAKIHYDHLTNKGVGARLRVRADATLEGFN